VLLGPPQQPVAALRDRLFVFSYLKPALLPGRDARIAPSLFPAAAGAVPPETANDFEHPGFELVDLEASPIGPLGAVVPIAG